MTTMTEIAADIAANLAASMADIQQRMAQVDAVLDELRAAGVELEINANNCSIGAYRGGKSRGVVSIQITKHPGGAAVMHDICVKGGTDWYMTENDYPLLSLNGISIHFHMPDSFPQDTTP